MVLDFKTLTMKPGDKVSYSNDLLKYGKYQFSLKVDIIVIPEKNLAPFVKLSNGNFVWLCDMGKINGGWIIDYNAYITISELLNVLLSITPYKSLNEFGEF